MGANLVNRFALTCVAAAVVLASGCGQSPLSPASNAGTIGDGNALSAKGGYKPLSEIPATAMFRCPGPACSGSDGIVGDGAPYGVVIGTDGNLRVSLTDPARRITFDYSDCLAPCPDGRRWFTTYTAPADQVYMHTSVLVPGTETETFHGMIDIPVGETWFSRIKMSFHAVSPSGEPTIFGLRFNPFYEGSTNLQVTRVGEDEWLFEATSAQIAWAVSLPEQTRGKPPKDPGDVFEGNYRLPFAITVTR